MGFCGSVSPAQELTLKDLAGIHLHVDASDAMMKIAKAYFRSQPFSQRFSSFIGSLQKDPWFTVENYERRTDSTFFFLSGSYKNFNPFRYTAKEVRLIIAEEQFIHADSLQTPDTIINLQLMGIIDSAASAADIIQKEFNRFHRMYQNDFGKFTYDHASKKGVITAEMHTYFFPVLAISPVTTAWGQLMEGHQYTFTITIRFKLKENQACFVLFPDEQ